MTASLVIAIDGPSGAGKSTVSKELARRLGLAYFDTGAMYRAAAVWLERHGALDQPEAMPALIDGMPLELNLDPDAQRFVLGGDDITALIRTTEVSTYVSKVSTCLGARDVLVAWQQRVVARERTAAGWSEGRGVVAEGRDITTVVAPDAEVRVLLTASEAARLARRALEVHGKADAAAIAATTDQVVRRDRDDSTVARFMDAPPGVTVVDSSNLTIEQTVRAILDLIPG
ncbi:MAG: (d)CMP kinase [Bifidobacteriaceae bacterium]|nr:(d)CMP kinase [Bifidobacteriaceae bacterium]